MRDDEVRTRDLSQRANAIVEQSQGTRAFSASTRQALRTQLSASRAECAASQRMLSEATRRRDMTALAGGLVSAPPAE